MNTRPSHPFAPSSQIPSDATERMLEIRAKRLEKENQTDHRPWCYETSAGNSVGASLLAQYFRTFGALTAAATAFQQAQLEALTSTKAMQDSFDKWLRLTRPWRGL